MAWCLLRSTKSRQEILSEVSPNSYRLAVAACEAGGRRGPCRESTGLRSPPTRPDQTLAHRRSGCADRRRRQRNGRGLRPHDRCERRIRGGCRQERGTAQRVADEIAARVERAIAVRLEIEVKADIEKAMQATVETYDRLDVLINVAVGLREEEARAQWDAAFHVNVRSALALSLELPAAPAQEPVSRNCSRRIAGRDAWIRAVGLLRAAERRANYAQPADVAGGGGQQHPDQRRHSGHDPDAGAGAGPERGGDRRSQDAGSARPAVVARRTGRRAQAPTCGTWSGPRFKDRMVK